MTTPPETKPLTLNAALAPYKPLSPYERGYISALSDYGIWRDGVQRIGAMNRSIAEVATSFLTTHRANRQEEVVPVLEDAGRTRQVLKNAGMEDHIGGGGDTYYDRPTFRMAEELVAERDSLRRALGDES